MKKSTHTHRAEEKNQRRQNQWPEVMVYKDFWVTVSSLDMERKVLLLSKSEGK